MRAHSATCPPVVLQNVPFVTAARDWRAGSFAARANLRATTRLVAFVYFCNYRALVVRKTASRNTAEKDRSKRLFYGTAPVVSIDEEKRKEKTATQKTEKVLVLCKPISLLNIT